MKLPKCSVSLMFLAIFVLTMSVQQSTPSSNTTLIATATDETTTKTSMIMAPSSALPLQMLPHHDQRINDDDEDTIMDDDGFDSHQHQRNDYNAFQLFKNLVYPLRFPEPQSSPPHKSPHPAALARRNITFDALSAALQQPSEPYWPRRSDRPASSSGSTAETIQDRNYFQPYGGGGPYYPSALAHQPHTFQYGGGMFGHGIGNSMSNLMDPLFVMATLAFVTFLINSILGLVDRLNLLPSSVHRARQRHGKYAPKMGAGENGEWIVWPDHRGGVGSADGDPDDGGREDLLEELETRIRTAFEEYERCYVSDSCKRSGV